MLLVEFEGGPLDGQSQPWLYDGMPPAELVLTEIANSDGTNQRPAVVIGDDHPELTGNLVYRLQMGVWPGPFRYKLVNLPPVT